ncbi:hypothetical protein LOZ66_000260 [Ophidiomyces ophidiicola]|nr:hypothetical protein LOZ66_000260 [Ophidiomyces ophidiicola]
MNSLSRTRPVLRHSTRSASRYFSAAPAPQSNSQRSRLEALHRRLPRFLHPYTTPLLKAPIAHITSFLILHEITAVVPLFGLVGVFHYGGWLPTLGNEGEANNAFDEGVNKFSRWLRKKGWVKNDIPTQQATDDGVGESAADLDPSSRQGVRLILEFATAYAITKALLPLRIVASLGATPWFARCVLGPIGRNVGRILEYLKRTPKRPI